MHRPAANHTKHPSLIWRLSDKGGYELVLDSFARPLGRAVQLGDGHWRTIARAPGRPLQGATAGSVEQARRWLTRWATPIAWRHRPDLPGSNQKNPTP